MNVTEMPLVEPPCKLPEGFELRSDGKLWAIWAPLWNTHCDCVHQPSIHDLGLMLSNLCLMRLFDEFPDAKYKEIFRRKALAEIRGDSLDADDLKYLTRGEELRKLARLEANGQA